MEIQSIVRHELRKTSKTFIHFGLLILITGIVAIAHSISTGNISTIVMGIYLVIAGSFRLIFSIVTFFLGSGFARHLYALLMLIAGIWLVVHPEMGLQTLTTLMAIFFIIDGITSVFYSLSLMSVGGRFNLFIGGILTGLLGILILLKWPESSKYFLGIYVGVKLIFDGVALALTGKAIRKSNNEHA